MLKNRMLKLVMGLMVGVMVSSSFGTAQAASKEEIESGVDKTLERFYKEVSEGKNLVQKAKGILVFPAVFKAGIGLGGEYGEGALQVKGKTVDYYNTAAASLGFQLGVQKKSIVIIFQEDSALQSFRSSSGWKAGVDASIAIVKIGAGGAMDTAKLNEPILGFIIGQRGLMYNLTLEGAKFSKIDR